MRTAAGVLLAATLLGACARGSAIGRDTAAQISAGAPAARRQSPVAGRSLSSFAHLPIRFEPNVGQAPGTIAYLARGSGYSVAITEEGATLSLHRGAAARMGKKNGSLPATGSLREEAWVRLSLVHARANPELRAEQRQASVSNYFLGGDPAKWRSNVANYAAVRYRQVYAGVDWVVYGKPAQLEYDFIVAPQADPREIRLKFEGARRVQVNGDGDLLITVQDRILRQLKPVVYQIRPAGERQPVDAHYVLDHQKIAFAIGDFDHSRELIIDPVFVYSTYLGGSGWDFATAIAADGAGNAYVAGTTASPDFPTSGPYQRSFAGGVSDCFVAKFNAMGSELLYATYLGGRGWDETHAIAVDKDGNVYLAGMTWSTDFPTVAAIQATNRGGLGDAFVAKLNTTGDRLVYSTYLGGSGSDQAYGISVDDDGDAYVAGSTTSTDFPTAAALQTTNHSTLPGLNAFIAKLNAAGSALVYSTYLGGSVDDEAYAIAVDGKGSAYVTGSTFSGDFPTVNPFQREPAPNGIHAFVAKLNPAGSALAYSTYLGGSGSDQGNGIAVDGAGNAYVTGDTNSSDFPVVNAFQGANAAGTQAAFVTKLNATGNAAVYSTYFTAGVDGLGSSAIAVDKSGNAYIAGGTAAGLPTINPLQAQDPGVARGTGVAFVSQFNATGNALTFSTYLGGSGGMIDPAIFPSVAAGDSAAAIAVDNAGNIYVAGSAGSADFPVSYPYQATNRAFASYGTNAFVTKIATEPDPGLPESRTGGGGALGWEMSAALGIALAIRRRRVP